MPVLGWQSGTRDACCSFVKRTRAFWCLFRPKERNPDNHLRGILSSFLKNRSRNAQRERWPTPKRGQSPQPSRLPNGKSKLGQLNTVRWQRQSTVDKPDHWPQRLSGSALSRAMFLRRNERNPTETFPRSNSITWSCFVDHQSRCRGRVPWEPSGGVPSIWCPNFDFPF